MALTFAAYAVPEEWSKPAAVAAIIGLTAVNYFGVTRTAGLTRVIVLTVLTVLALVVITGTVVGDATVCGGSNGTLQLIGYTPGARIVRSMTRP